MTNHPEVAIIGDEITIRAHDSTVTLGRDEWDMVRDIVERHDPPGGSLGRRYRHPVTPAKWGRKA